MPRWERVSPSLFQPKQRRCPSVRITPRRRFSNLTCIIAHQTDEGDPAEETSDEPAVEELTTNEDGLVVFPTITETIWDTETTETMTTTFVEEQETIVEERKCCAPEPPF